jgi:hypothetical protein
MRQAIKLKLNVEMSNDLYFEMDGVQYFGQLKYGPIYFRSVRGTIANREKFRPTHHERGAAGSHEEACSPR